jgi:hypothetical protein
MARRERRADVANRPKLKDVPDCPDILTVGGLGTWRVGAMYQPLFTAFGPAAIESRALAAVYVQRLLESGNA